jgi:hypothetical protein
MEISNEIRNSDVFKTVSAEYMQLYKAKSFERLPVGIQSEAIRKVKQISTNNAIASAMPGSNYRTKSYASEKGTFVGPVNPVVAKSVGGGPELSTRLQSLYDELEEKKQECLKTPKYLRRAAKCAGTGKQPKMPWRAKMLQDAQDEIKKYL